jgi:foldase protein PrsA
MMNQRLARTKLAAVFCAAAAMAALVAGCGGIPGDAVATVDGNPITKASFTHWMAVAAKSGGQTSAGIPQPPDFAACVAAKRKAQPQPAKGQPTTTDAQLKTQKKASFPKDADYQRFLKQSGQSQADILLRVRLDVLSNKLRTKITKGKDQVTQADIQSYYDANKARFAQPERRDLLVVLTKTQAKAQQAKQELQNGQSFAKVAKQLSIDQASKAQGGKLAAVAKGQQEKALDTAVFSAQQNALTGPVKTQFGYYVFKVTKITPASQQSLQQASTTIKQLLSSQKQQKALDTFVKSFQKRWKGKTDCRDGFQTQDCKNAPKKTAVPSPTVGSVPTTGK